MENPVFDQCWLAITKSTKYYGKFGTFHTAANSDNALAGLIREIRNEFLYVPGFRLSELEEFVSVASTS